MRFIDDMTLQEFVVVLIWAVTGVVLYLICSFVLRVATNAYHAW